MWRKIYFRDFFCCKNNSFFYFGDLNKVCPLLFSNFVHIMNKKLTWWNVDATGGRFHETGGDLLVGVLFGVPAVQVVDLVA
jgi:hypothetical protein